MRRFGGLVGFAIAAGGATGQAFEEACGALCGTGRSSPAMAGRACFRRSPPMRGLRRIYREG